MITKQDILDRAGEWQLRPDIVEKDYVLGWLLAAIANHPVISNTWVFKGGTCLKKCYFETYRFSEDLDFTLLPSAAYTEVDIRRALQEFVRSTADLSGLYLPENEVRVVALNDRLGRSTFEGRIYYRGPLERGGDLARVLFDLTQHEEVITDTTRQSVFHPYPDELPKEASVQTYSLDELLAEKMRALFERTRPRDLYDVVYMLENRPEQINLDHAREVFRTKCRTKGLTAPTADALILHIEQAAELRSEWSNMLAHQLPQLPPIESMIDRERLTGILRWIDVTTVLPASRLPAPKVGIGEELVAPSGIQYWGRGSALENLRFAGANHLLVEFLYKDRTRHVEPYSLRRARTGNLLLYGWEQGATTIKAFIVDNIQNLRVTTFVFSPRYRVELSTSAPVLTPPVQTRGGGRRRSVRKSRRRTR